MHVQNCGHSAILRATPVENSVCHASVLTSHETFFQNHAFSNTSILCVYQTACFCLGWQAVHLYWIMWHAVIIPNTVLHICTYAAILKICGGTESLCLCTTVWLRMYGSVFRFKCTQIVYQLHLSTLPDCSTVRHPPKLFHNSNICTNK